MVEKLASPPSVWFHHNIMNHRLKNSQKLIQILIGVGPDAGAVKNYLGLTNSEFVYEVYARTGASAKTTNFGSGFLTNHQTKLNKIT